MTQPERHDTGLHLISSDSPFCRAGGGNGAGPGLGEGPDPAGEPAGGGHWFGWKLGFL